jgi:hypothetical protein
MKTKKKPTGKLLFVRLRNYDDLVGYVSKKGTKLKIRFPLRVDIGTIGELGKQFVALQEYLPQVILTENEIEFDIKEVSFTTTVRDDFIPHYEKISNFYYVHQVDFLNQKGLPKKTKTVNEIVNEFENSAEEKDDEEEEEVSNIIEFVNKKDKPLH